MCLGYFQIKLLHRNTPGPSLPHWGVSLRGPAQNPMHVSPIPQALTAVVFVRVILTVLLPVTLRVLFADAASTAALVRVLLAGDCGLASCRKDGGTGVSPGSREVTSPSPLLPTPCEHTQEGAEPQGIPSEAAFDGSHPHLCCSRPHRSHPHSRPCHHISVCWGHTSRCRT